METVTSASERGASPQLHRTTAEEEFRLSLPCQDPIAAQQLLCEALARLFTNREFDERRLRATLAFDQQAQQISKRLLLLYCAGDAQLRSLDRRYFISAQQLCLSFAQAYAHLLAHIECSADPSWRKCADTVLVQLFRHRQVELLLRLFRYKKRNSDQWRQLIASYRTACAQGPADHRQAPGSSRETLAPERTVEQQFIDALLLGAMNTGQFSPHELLWASNWIARWRGLLTLQSDFADASVRDDWHEFVVDLGAAEGLRRFRPGDTGDLLHLDTVPLVQAIDEEILATKGASGAPHSAESTEQHMQKALLCKLKRHFAPVRVHVKRRGERNPVDYSVYAISGLPQIVQMLREDAQKCTEQMAASAGQVEGVTISPFSGHTLMSASLLGAGGLASFTIAATPGTRPQTWQVKDHSDSGCRLRGQTSILNSLIPGSLIAIRERENPEWTLAVVRRLRRLMVEHLEVGVEHIGRKPRFVKIVTNHDLVPSADDSPNNRARCFGALYLPASEAHPTMPIKTLLVPATAFVAGTAITLLSATAAYTLRLNKPLERQADFVWTSFTVIDKTIAKSQR